MNKSNALIIFVLTIFLSGCIQNEGVNKNSLSDFQDIESMDIPYFEIEGTYLDRVNISTICSKFNGEISINNKSGVKKYSDISRSILNNINSALGCNISVPVTIVKHDSYGAIAKEEGIFLTTGVFDESDYIDEIAVVISHELVHYIHDHPRLTIEAVKLVKKEKDLHDQFLNSEDSSILGDTKNFFLKHQGTVFNIEESRVQSSLAMQHEIEADHIGTDLLVKAGYSPQALTYNLEKLRACLDYQDGDLNSAFNSLREQADAINSSTISKDEGYSNYLGFISNTINITNNHVPVPWREQMLLKYVKNKYPDLLRKEMITNI
ncbi:M48 family metalloprotease [Marinomonas sp.]|uniref:M48 family metalloprotease n=1 Tax=Marinomonas sp. TaxID=1904862 RepID=UPI003A91AE8B